MKLIVKNDWESITYYFPRGVEIPNDRGGVVQLTTGENIAYRSEKREAQYEDHGHQHNVTQHILIASIPFNNQLIDVELKELDIDRFLHINKKENAN